MRAPGKMRGGASLTAQFKIDNGMKIRDKLLLAFITIAPSFSVSVDIEHRPIGEVADNCKSLETRRTPALTTLLELLHTLYPLIDRHHEKFGHAADAISSHIAHALRVPINSFIIVIVITILAAMGDRFGPMRRRAIAPPFIIS